MEPKSVALINCADSLGLAWAFYFATCSFFSHLHTCFNTILKCFFHVFSRKCIFYNAFVEENQILVILMIYKNLTPRTFHNKTLFFFEESLKCEENYKFIKKTFKYKRHFKSYPILPNLTQSYPDLTPTYFASQHGWNENSNKYK